MLMRFLSKKAHSVAGMRSDEHRRALPSYSTSPTYYHRRRDVCIEETGLSLAIRTMGRLMRVGSFTADGYQDAQVEQNGIAKACKYYMWLERDMTASSIESIATR
jgi:hypothetical protein